MLQTKPQNKIVTLMLAAITIIYSGYALFPVYNKLKYLLVISAVLVSPFLLSYIVRQRKFNFDDVTVAFMVFLITTGMGALSARFEGITTYVLFALFLLTAMGITLMYTFEQFIEFFLKAMVGIAVIGLVGYFLVNYTGFENLLPKFVNTNGVQYRGVFVFFCIALVPDRNCGIFWEPGIFATFLLFAILFEMMFKGRPINKRRMVLFIIAMLTTTSSAGYALLLFCGLLWLSMKYHESRSYFAKVTMLLSLIILCAVVLGSNFIIANTSLENNRYLSKLLFKNILASSRVQAIKHNLSVFLDYPLFGAGFQIALDTAKHVSDTSTSTYMMSVFGIGGLLYTVWWALGIYRLKQFAPLTRLLLFFIIMCIVNKEPHMFNLFTWIVMFYFMKGISAPKKTLTEKGVLRHE